MTPAVPANREARRPNRPTVLSTRPAGAADPLVTALEEAGVRCVPVPTVATVPAESIGELAAALADLPEGAWVVVTSRRGARAAHDALAASGRRPETLRWAAVAETTAAALRVQGISGVVVGNGTGADLAAAIEPGRDLGGVSVLLPRADAASPRLPARLRERNARVTEVVAYRTLEGPEDSREPLREALADPDLAAVVFASGSAVRGLLALGGSEATETLARVPLVTIGPSTTSTLRRLGLRVAAQASRPAVPDLVDAVRTALKTRPPRREPT